MFITDENLLSVPKAVISAVGQRDPKDGIFTVQIDIDGNHKAVEVHAIGLHEAIIRATMVCDALNVKWPDHA